MIASWQSFRIRGMRKIAFMIGLAGFVMLGIASANAQSLKHCFTDSQFDGWWRITDNKTLYIRTNHARYYRLDLTQQCGLSGFPGAHLIFNIHGSDIICSPLDFDLRVSEGLGDIPRPCFVKKMREVSTGEIAALKNLKP